MRLAEIEGDEENIRDRMWHIVAYIFVSAGVITGITLACIRYFGG